MSDEDLTKSITICHYLYWYGETNKEINSGRQKLMMRKFADKIYYTPERLTTVFIDPTNMNMFGFLFWEVSGVKWSVQSPRGNQEVDWWSVYSGKYYSPVLSIRTTKHTTRKLSASGHYLFEFVDRRIDMFDRKNNNLEVRTEIPNFLKGTDFWNKLDSNTTVSYHIIRNL